MSTGTDNSRRFYEAEVKPLIHNEFGQYEGRIAVGLAGEGSDCFGYDDFMSRDHDFGTGVCLWLTDEDFRLFGAELSKAYNDLAARQPGNNLSARLQERRGVMTIHDFYSNILNIDCDTENCIISDSDWQALDHSCLATAVNGEVFRDDPGVFLAFRKKLLDYYPDHIWRIRLMNELHSFAQALQVNYARCMTRGDVVAARLCHMQGLKSAMELFFLLKRLYPPYYKWTFRRMTEVDNKGRFSGLIKQLSEAPCDVSKWDSPYDPHRLNTKDNIVVLTEEIASEIVAMLRAKGLTEGFDPYLERYVNELY